MKVMPNSIQNQFIAQFCPKVISRRFAKTLISIAANWAIVSRTCACVNVYMQDMNENRTDTSISSFR